MKSTNFSLPLIIILFFFTVVSAKAQKSDGLKKRKMESKMLKHSKALYTDSLMSEFEDQIYSSIYHSGANRIKPTFTILKIEIDKEGNVKDIKFSDSADTLLVKTYLNRHKYHDDKATLEKYTKAMSFRDIAILIPVNYEPFYNSKNTFNAGSIADLMKFNKKDFTGNSIMLSPIQIRILSENNM